MASLVGALIHDPAPIFASIQSEQRLVRLNVKLMVAGIVGAMLWGAAVGAYVGRLHLLLTIIKMPIFFMLTLVVSFSLMHVVLSFSRVSMRVSQTLALTLSTISVTTIVLGALAPVIAFFCIVSPIPNYTSYLNLYLTSALCGVIAGLFGLRHMARGLRAMAGQGMPIRGALFACVFIYQFVGAQVAYVLRPWIGSSYGIDGMYSLEHGFDGNFYTGVFTVFCRWLSEMGVV